MRNVVYTCITQGYDEIPLDRPEGDFDFFCFLDQVTFDRNRERLGGSSGIEFRVVSANESPQETNRRYKIRAHDFLSKYSHSIYIDGNIRLKQNPFEVFNRIPGETPVALYAQPHRECAYREIDELVRVGIAKARDASRLKSAMRVFGLPSNYGLFEANVIFRRHMDPRCILLMDVWWSLWRHAVIKRDQPLLAFANFLTSGQTVSSLGFSVLLSELNPYFFYKGRLAKKSRIKRLLRRLGSELLLYKGE